MTRWFKIRGLRPPQMPDVKISDGQMTDAKAGAASGSEARNNERGVVLLTTLLVMTIMVTLSVAILDDMRYALRRTINVQSHAQTQWYISAAQDFAQSYLSSNLAGLDDSAINTVLRDPAPQVLPIDGGTLILRVSDGSQCISLGSLTDTPGRRQFETLLNLLDIDARLAANLSAALVDWQDRDSQISSGGAEDFTYLGLTPDYRAANTAFSSVMEIRAVQGMSAQIYERILPFICAREAGQISRININTLNLGHAPLLASVLGEEHLQLAVRLITERPAGGYEDVDGLRGAQALEGVDQSSMDFDSFISFAPEHLWVEADISFLEARRFVAVDFSRSGDSLMPRHRFLTMDARRPVMRLAEDETDL